MRFRTWNAKKTKHPARLCPSPRVQHLDKPPSSLNILELSKAGSIDNGSIGESVSNTCSKGLAEPHEYIYPRDGLRRPRRVNAAFWARSPGLRLASTSHRSMPFSPPGHGALGPVVCQALESEGLECLGDVGGSMSVGVRERTFDPVVACVLSVCGRFL